MGGPRTPQPAVYGALGSPSLSNFPGNRELAASWTDNKGNLWLFGGNGFAGDEKEGYLNDLWEYDPSTREWSWISGSDAPNTAGTYGSLGTPAVANVPPGREGATTWTDAKGNLWLFGGYSYATGWSDFNDLWEYNPSLNEWTWVSGSSTPNQSGVYGNLGTPAPGNVPGAREEAVSWIDSKGNLWLFGGEGIVASGSSHELNDLWEFSPSTNEWTWMGGSNTGGQPGVYGTQGTPSRANIPGARYSATAWTDSQGNFWLFGGAAWDSAGIQGILNDLWEFNPSTGAWTWVAGDSTRPSTCSPLNVLECGTPSVYGSLQTLDAAGMPGARMGARSWTDRKGNLWLFGGAGIDATGNWGYLDDLWRFDLSVSQWEWMSGDQTVVCGYTFCVEPGVYGTWQTPALGSTPAGRSNAVGWTDANGKLWLFSGTGTNLVGVWGYFQDLWEFQPNTDGGPVTATPDFSPAPGSYSTLQTVTISDMTSGVNIYYTINGNTPASQYTDPITISSPVIIEAIATAPGYANSNTVSATFQVEAPPAARPTFSPASGTYDGPQTVSIGDATAGATIYYTTDGSLPTTSSAVYSAPIAVASPELVVAMAVAPKYSDSPAASAVYTISASTSSGAWIWWGGSNQENQSGSYGSLNSPSPNNVPGSRAGAATWTDPDNNLWLFGGSGIDANGSSGLLNDLWKYVPGSHSWAWMGGPNILCTQPYNRMCAGHAGVYGTLGVPAPGNSPGGRRGAAKWVDAGGNLWLFGGYGYDAVGRAGELNDLWEFNATTRLWTWMGGSRQGSLSSYSGAYGNPGLYGTLGVAAPGNIPGGRYDAASWIDSKGDVWIFGGTGEDAGSDLVTLNDLWEFNPSTNQWTWMGGADVIQPLSGTEGGVYGTHGLPGASNYPPSRAGAAAWTDSSGNLWLFGGMAGGPGGFFNDLWKYNPSTNTWAWISGGQSSYCAFNPLVGYNACSTQPGVYGTLGVPAPENTPGGGSHFATWTDQQGRFWLFGGESDDITGQSDGFYLGRINALWVFDPSTTEWTWMGEDYAASNCSFVSAPTLPLVICDGSQGLYGVPGLAGVSNIPATSISAASWTGRDGKLWLFGGSVTNLSDYPGSVNDLWGYQPSVTTLPAATVPIFSLKSGTYATGGPLLIANGMANASIYYTTDGTLPTTASNIYSGPITLSSTETLQAMATAPGYRPSAVASASYIVRPTPAAPILSPGSGTYTSIETVTISDVTPDANIFYTTDADAGTTTNWMYYSGPVTVASSETLTAVAALPGESVRAGITDTTNGLVVSPYAAATYMLNLPPAAAPRFALPAGTYTSAQSVTITDETAGAKIYYTTNGTIPTTSSSLYGGPVAILSTTTLQAIAVANGYATSPITSGTYTIDSGIPPDFLMAVTPASLTVSRGGNGTALITITPQNGFTSGVSFTCLGLPPRRHVQLFSCDSGSLGHLAFNDLDRKHSGGYGEWDGQDLTRWMYRRLYAGALVSVLRL